MVRVPLGVIVLVVSMTMPALVALPADAMEVTLHAPQLLGSGVAAHAFGRATLQDGLAFPPGVSVEVLDGEDVVGRANTTGAEGEWAAAIRVTGRGPHTLHARIAHGTPLAATSAPLVVHVAQPPAAPEASVTLVQGTLAARVAWTPPADDGGGRITGYRVERLASAGAWEPRANVGSLARSVDDAAPPASAPHYRVVALNVAGPSAPSTSVAASAPTPPPAADLRALPRDLTGHDLSWTLPASGDVQGYRLLRAQGDAAPILLATLPPGATTYFDDVGGSPARFRYSLHAANIVAESPPAFVDATFPTPDPPQDVIAVVVPAPNFGAYVNVEWKPNAGGKHAPTEYVVERADLDAPSWSTIARVRADAASRASDGSVEEGRAYAYRVRGVGPTGIGAPSPDVPTFVGPESGMRIHAPSYRVCVSDSPCRDVPNGARVEHSASSGEVRIYALTRGYVRVDGTLVPAATVHGNGTSIIEWHNKTANIVGVVDFPHSEWNDTTDASGFVDGVDPMVAYDLAAHPPAAPANRKWECQLVRWGPLRVESLGMRASLTGGVSVCRV